MHFLESVWKLIAIQSILKFEEKIVQNKEGYQNFLMSFQPIGRQVNNFYRILEYDDAKQLKVCSVSFCGEFLDRLLMYSIP